MSAGGTAIASAPTSQRVPVAAHAATASHRHHGGAGGPSCYRQLDNDNGIAVVSQNFEVAYDIYDSRAADDFTLTKRCRIGKVAVNGTYYLGVGPVDSVHVTIYKDNDRRIGGIVSTQNKLRYTDPTDTGNLKVTLAKPVNLAPGRYWISVKANMHFSLAGQWEWNTNNRAVGEKSKWANPNDGFGTGCTRYRDTVKCLPIGEGPDFSFALLR